jgi:uncharacterized protein DUF3105
VSRDPDDARRLTKAERKDQARQEREALQQRLASRRRRNRFGMGLIASGVVVAAFAFFVTPDEGGIPTPQALLARADDAASSASCSDAETTPSFEPADQDRQHISAALGGPPLSAYATTPPASGPHADVTLGAGVYDSLTLEELYGSLHSLEHGATIVWYDPTAPAEKIADLTSFFDRRLQDAAVGQDRVIVAPYDFPGDAGGLLPDGQQMALVAWHRLRSCGEVNLAVAYDFTSEYSFPTSSERDYQGEAPEPGGAI